MKVIHALGFAAFLGIVGLVGEWETHYTRLATCTHIEYETRIAEFTDNSGNIWKWEIQNWELRNENF